MHQTIIDLLKKGVDANNTDEFRRGNMVILPSTGSLIAGGDIHGHLRNFQRIKNFANLPENPDTHVLLQEIIHGGIEDCQGDCASYRLLFEAVRYKLEFPNQVHFVMANHDTSFINNSEVMKDGKEMNRSMRNALDREFEQCSEEIKLAIRQFLFSEPLAVKCENGIWLSHSLPADRYAEGFNLDIFDRELRINDIVRPGAAYLLTWGRRHSKETLDLLAKSLQSDIFVLGHQAQKSGWSHRGDNLLIIASDHNHGCLLKIDLSKSYSMPELVESIVPMASIS